jgi:hypothetical protein|nr:MAG TPA: hypothetical protein [Caudoviricetes sp.]
MIYTVDELKLYNGLPIQITDKIIMKVPTLGQICEFGDNNYFSFVQTFTATPMDENMIVFLTDIGIDFNNISNFELFMLLIRIMPKGSELLFENNIDFSKFELKTTDDDISYLENSDGVIINEGIYNLMLANMRAINNVPIPKITKVKDDPIQKQMAIEDARNQLESRKRKAMFKPSGSALMPIVSSMVNSAGFKHNEKTVFDMNIYAFWDSVNRISAIKNADHLYRGLYSGCLDLKSNPSLKKEMDWMRKL